MNADGSAQANSISVIYEVDVPGIYYQGPDAYAVGMACYHQQGITDVYALRKHGAA